MNDIIKRGIISDRNNLQKTQLNKIIPYRKNSIDRKNIKITSRTDSSKMGNVKNSNIDKTNNKIIINNFRKNTSNNNVKLLNDYNMYSSLNNNYEKFNEI